MRRSSRFSRYDLPEKMERRAEPGQIHLIAGPMFSGKTTELFRLCNRHSLAKRKVCIVKYARDNRYDDVMICTHDLRKMDAISALRIGDVYSQLIEHDVIGVDEGQFFEDVCEMAERLSNLGKIVIVAALNADYKREPFLAVSKLFALAEKVDKLNAVCGFCGDSAPFTLRTVRCTKREVIGGQEMYQASCRNCYHELHSSVINSEKQEMKQPNYQKETPPKPLQDLNNTTSPVF